jgi:hypothetical protein
MELKPGGESRCLMRLIQPIVCAAILYSVSLSAADVQWDNGGGDNDWGNPLNWSGNTLPITGLGTTGDKIHINLNGANRAVYSAATATNTYQFIRVGDSANGELIVSGGSLSSDSTTPTYIGSVGGSTGVLTQTGGSTSFGGYMEVGLGANAIGTINLSGGTLTSARNGTVGGVSSVSIALADGNNAQGNLILSGGLLLTRTGVLLGNSGGKGRFEVRGGGFASIGTANSADDGFWLQSSGSVLAAYVTNGSLGTIYIDKVAGTGGTYGNGNVIFMPGSKLEVGFLGTPSPGTWTVMRWGGTVLTNGLSFAAGTDPNWSFTIDNTNGLRITYGTPPSALTNTTFVHPGVMHTFADLDRMKTNVLAGNNPWFMGYTNMLADSHSSSTYAIQGPQTTIVRDTTTPSQWENDCGAAYQNALLWYLTGDYTHAAKAIQILDAWSGTCTNFWGSDARLTAGLQGFKFITAAELIRYTGAGWSQGEINTCSNFIRTVILPVNRMYGGGNWGQIGGISAMAAGVFLEDEAVFNEAINCIKFGSPIECDMGIANYIDPVGFTMEADRDLGHWGLALDNLSEGAATAWCQGVDLWTFLNNRLLVAHEYLGRYALTTNVPSYTAYDQCDGPGNGGLTTVGLGTTLAPYWERAFHTYQNLIGVPAPWCSNMVNRIRPEGYDRDHVAFGTLVSALPTRTVGLPVLPSELSATWTNAQVKLTWNSASNATGYIVKRATWRGGPYTNIALVSATNYTDSAVANDVLYFYKVSATNVVGETENSGLASAYPSASAPTAPAGLIAETTSHVRIDLTWNAVPGATSYVIKRATNSGGPYAIIATGVGTTFLIYGDSGAAPDSTYYYVVSAVNSVGASVDSSEASARTLPALPGSWNYSDAGYVTTPGNAIYTNGAFTVMGAGLDYGGGSSDSFGFAYMPLKGDGEIVARLVARTNYSRLNKTGIALRETLSNGSRNFFLQDDGAVYRTVTDGNSSSTGNATNLIASFPQWFRLNRTGNIFTGSISSNGVDWQTVNSVSMTMSNTLLAGLAVCSRNNGWLDTEVFDNVTVTTTPPSARVHLKFDEAGGTTAVDSTGNGWNGTLQNGATWTAGYSNNAVNLSSNSSQYVSLPSGVMTNITDFTIAAWINLSSVANWNRIFDFGTGTSVYMFLSPRSSSGAIRYAITTGSSAGEQQINGTSPLPIGGWHHVAVTQSGMTGILYVDGVAVGTNSSMTLNPSNLGNTTQNYIGRSQWADPYLNGRVDEFRIYRGVLAVGEIAVLASALRPPSGLTALAQDGQVALSWDASPLASSYNLKRSIVSGGPYSLIASNLSAFAFIDSGVSNGTLYFYSVSAFNGFGESTDSAPVAARPVSTSAPQLAVVVGGGQMQFTWPSDHIGWHLQAQTNSLGNGLGTNWITVTASSATNQISLPISGANESVFFRLIYP